MMCKRHFLALSKEFEPWRVSIFGDKIHLLVDNKGDVDKIKDVPTEQIKPIPFTLEDAFIAVVQKKEAKNSANK